ncbi:MAG: sensor histidine kinase [Chloroflexota bacterium]|nr:HAMP domain-containing sensor histidine kinase [Lentimicrobium sp.]
MGDLKQAETIEKDLSFSLQPDKPSEFITILKDSSNNCISFNFSDTTAELTFNNFYIYLPEYYFELIESIIKDKTDDWQTGLVEHTHSTEFNGILYSFLITKCRIKNNGGYWYNYIVKCIERTVISKANAKHLASDKYLYDINCKCISSVSHDFRTPLSIIYANLQLLEQHEGHLDAETINDAFSLSRMAVKSLLRVLDKVSVVDSINKSRLEYKPTSLKLKELCENLVKELNDAEVTPNRVNYIHDERISEVHIDEYLFVSLFTHLIFNALSYSRKNHKVLFQSTVGEDGYLKFVVADYGIGLTLEQLDALSVFFAVPVSELPDGIGLGLAIVKECLNLQRGNISITSEPGKGSIFTICLPNN